MVKDLIHALNGVLLGKSETVELLVMALLADGHVLVEDVPGTGKTTLSKALAAAIGADFARIQFTPDLLPADVTVRYSRRIRANLKSRRVLCLRRCC